jgi:ferric-dicitrate binding protein FerR (iron transport regulator)
MSFKTHHIIAIAIMASVVIGLVVGSFMKNRTITVLAEDKKVMAYLPDSTLVNLAPNAKLKYRRKFKKRTLKIVNQAYIEMGQVTDEPIFIENEHLKIILEGSQFYIDFDKEQEEYLVIAITGEATVEVRNASGQSIATVEEGDEMRFNAAGNILQVTKNTDPNFMAWQTETITFDNHSIEAVIESLSHHFDKQLKVNHPDLKYCTISGEYPTQIDSIVTGICNQLNIKFEKTDRSYILMGKGCPLADEY